jgi:aspartate kinase
MTVVVQKFGGSSLADLDRLGEVADWVRTSRQRCERLVVVVSAMGKTTEELLALARRAGAQVAAEAAATPPRRELDLLVSTGERVSMALLAIALAARGVSAVSLTGSQAGIITTEHHFDARILELRPRRVEAELARGNVVIVAGYQGVSRAGEVTTLGRGGSDTTAVAIADALGAARCEIYSDVDGVYSADPRRVPSARHLARIDYDTLGVMADAGAKVLCARAVDFGRTRGTPIHARATRDFAVAGYGRETVVSPATTSSATRARAVVVNAALGLASVDASALPRLASVLGEAGLAARDVVERDGCAFLTLPFAGVPDIAGVRRELFKQAPAGFSLEDCAELTAVGDDVHSEPERVAAAIASLPEPALLDVRGPRRLSVVLPRQQVARAEARWHQLFVECA